MHVCIGFLGSSLSATMIYDSLYSVIGLAISAGKIVEWFRLGFSLGFSSLYSVIGLAISAGRNCILYMGKCPPPHHVQRDRPFHQLR